MKKLIIAIFFISIFALQVMAGWSPPCMGAQCDNPEHSPVHLIPFNTSSGLISHDINTTQTGNVTTSGGYGFGHTGTGVFVNINRNSTTGDTGWSRNSVLSGTDAPFNDSEDVTRYDEGTFCASYYVESGSWSSNFDIFSVGDAANDGKQFSIYQNSNVLAIGNWDEDNSYLGSEGLGCVPIVDESWYSMCTNWTDTSFSFYVNNTHCVTHTGGNNGERGTYNSPGEPGIYFNTYPDASGESVNVTFGYATWWHANSNADNDLIGHYHRGDWPIAASATVAPEVIAPISCTSCNESGGDVVAPFTTHDTTPTFTFDTSVGANCRVGDENQNFSAMDSTRDCSVTGDTSHTCTLTVQDQLVASTDGVYVGCENSADGSDRANATAFFLMDITSLSANSSNAIESGIFASEIWPGATIYTDQQVFLRDLDNNQVLGTVDKIAVFGNQRWIINNALDGEQQIGLFNISPVVYVLDLINDSFESVSRQVSTLINATKS